ncbi:hypothetical protein MUB15_08275 [Priestia sp. OVS21]|nr:hypothetical protein [Priestia sp. OVS21]
MKVVSFFSSFILAKILVCLTSTVRFLEKALGTLRNSELKLFTLPSKLKEACNSISSLPSGLKIIICLFLLPEVDSLYGLSQGLIVWLTFKPIRSIFSSC